MSFENSIWDIDFIRCEEWGYSSSTARVQASTWYGDQIDFEMALHPDGYSVVYNFDLTFISKGLFPHQVEEIVNSKILPEAEKSLEDWWADVELTRGHLDPPKWGIKKGFPAPDLQYALLAYLYVLRADKAPNRALQLIAQDLSVPSSTIKERIRKSREKEFLSSPGKGMNGQGELTVNAKQLLKKAKIL